MDNKKRLLLTLTSFIVPIVGIVLYLTYSNKLDAKLFGAIGVIGILVYAGVGIAVI